MLECRKAMTTFMESVSAIALKMLSYDDSSGKVLLLAKKMPGSEMIRVSGEYLGANNLVGQKIVIEGDQKEDFIKAKSIIKGKDLRFLPYLRDLFDGKSVTGLTPEILKTLDSQIGTSWPNSFSIDSDKVIDKMQLADRYKNLAKKGWSKFKPFSKDYAILRNQGLSHQQAFNSIASLGKMASSIIGSNPYQLSGVKGIGFKTIDSIAIDRGVPMTSQRRINSLLDESILRLEAQGSTLFPISKLCSNIANNGRLPYADVQKYLQDMPASRFKKAISDDEGPSLIKSSSLFQAKAIAMELKRLTKGSVLKGLSANDIPSKFPLKDAQINAVNTTLESKLSIITGRPGTGKSTIADQVITGINMIQADSKIASCALSGKAARRLSETTGMPAKTIHSLLGFKPGKGFEYGADQKLDIDAIVIDEASMIDEALFLALLRAIPDRARVIIMGDYEQLPSVNAGQVLRDLIESDTIPVSRLKDILRVAPGSSLIPNAHKIADGKMPDTETSSEDNFQWVNAENDDDIFSKIKEIVMSQIALGINPDDMQILTPQMRKGPGTQAINKDIASIFNTNQKRHVHLNHMGDTFSIGDRVMQTKKNDYELGLNNGDIGKIESIDFASKTVGLLLNDKRVDVPFKKMTNLTLANAITIHKSQGSEYPVVIIPISKSHTGMLNIELIYTALTRGKSKVFMIGDKKTLESSLGSARNKKRTTILKNILKSEFNRDLSHGQEMRSSP